MQQPQKSASNGKKVVDGSIELTGILLTTLQDVVQMSPVPGLSNAASLALGILKMVKHRETAKLVKDACVLVILLVQEVQYRTKTIDKLLFNNTDELMKYLHSIQKFAEKEGRLGKLMLFLCYKSNMGKIQEYHKILRYHLEEEGARALKEQEWQTDALQDSSHSSALLAIATPPPPKLQTAFGDIQLYSLNRTFTFTSIAGDKFDNNNSLTVTNMNSGNTESTMVTGVYNN
ncbi:hypothetical protein BDQ12DRAFT_670564 [Crucibulum laeve]|uniref:Uncharacterized protein n=1 Tax=Crucibulum laeve TaxID=68775 RepID=A0A5C3LK39_9AGAR|nr:hypothetical protein BDQ12DRAFT_670564 [Crucibulum laeve]